MDLQKVPRLKLLMRWQKPVQYYNEHCPCAEETHEAIV